MNTQRIDAIIAACARRHRVSVADILGPRRFKHIVAARWEAIRAVAAEFPEFSTPRLGRIFGRDHTTILWALGRTARARRAALRQEAQTP